MFCGNILWPKHIEMKMFRCCQNVKLRPGRYIKNHITEAEKWLDPQFLLFSCVMLILILSPPRFPLFVPDAEHEWTGPFCFIQAADPQLGLMKAWRDGDCDGGGDEWADEVELTKQAVEAVNQLRPKPRFMVLCGDLVHAMPGTDRAQKRNKMHLKPIWVTWEFVASFL